jgi:hypothetical protein
VASSPTTTSGTERARREEAIRDEVRAFGGVLVEHTASRLIWVFGVPQGLDQLPQRAVHSALAIRQMVVEASAPEMPPCPVLRLALGEQCLAKTSLSPSCKLLPGFPRRQTLVSLDGVGSHERFGRVFLPSVLSHAYLAWSHAELGMFVERRVLGEEGLRIPEAVGQPGSLMVASWGTGDVPVVEGHGLAWPGSCRERKV